ncbi:VOC family protein [Nocardia sp. NPDC006630]|uniref:VOC family protein n=1 Tax=Nocardia sp. NPDC006630 TaxID=3157181 RepID=UPI0033B06D96
MSNQEDLPIPADGLLLTHFLTVRDVARSRDFYAEILSGRVVSEENPAIVKVANSWIIMNPGGGPTPDKPEVTLTPPRPGDPVSSFLNVRVADIAAFYAAAQVKGARFLTEPLDRKAELRCYLVDPDGYLIEVGQATGILRGILADLPSGES